MATAIVDSIEDVSCVEENGAVQELTRAAIVTGLTNTNTSYRTLNEVLTTLNSAGLTFNSSPTDMTNLVLVKRSPAMIGPTMARCTLEYVSHGRAGLNFTFRGGTSLRQVSKRVNLYGFPISVTHNGETQGGEVQVDLPEPSIVAEGIIQTDDPMIYSLLWTARVNSKRWGQANPGYAMVSDVQFIPIDTSASPVKYLFTFEFTFRTTGWDPEVYWTDPETGRPGTGLVANVGYKRVTSYPRRDFNELFPL